MCFMNRLKNEVREKKMARIISKLVATYIFI